MNAANRIHRDGGRQDGFTLVELMFALVIIAISVVALYQMFVIGSGWISEEYHRSRALDRAKYHMEQMAYYASAQDSVPRTFEGSYSEQLIPPDEDEDNAIEAEYTIHVAYSPGRDSEGKPYFSKVSLEYNWVEYSGRHQQIVIYGRF